MTDLRLNYLGSKKTLFPTLDKVFAKFVTKDTLFGDYFAGTGTVAYLVSKRYGCPVVSNDLQYYAYVINRARLSRYSRTDAAAISKLLQDLNALPPSAGFIARHYAPPARNCFTRANACKIDAMRAHLEKLRATLPEKVYFCALAKILVAADKVANTASVYVAYLKRFKASARRPIALTPFSPNGIRATNRVYNKDALALAKMPVTPHVVYLDPPYNHRQYAHYYHVLDTIAKQDAPCLIPGVAGMPSELTTSLFSSKPRAQQALSDLVHALRHVPVLILSYNNEGIIPQPALRNILATHGPVSVHKFPYPKFKQRAGNVGARVHEYVFVSTREPQHPRSRPNNPE